MIETIDLSGYRRMMNGVYDALQGAGGDVSTFLQDEAVRLNKMIVNFTPPLGQGGGASGAKAAGEKAIEKDLNSLFSEATPDLIKEVTSKHGTSNVDSWITKSDGTKERIRWGTVDVDGSRMRELHRAYRNKRGRVQRFKRTPGEWRSRVVVPRGSRKRYVKLVQSQVGKWKASISGLLAHFGKKLPTYIARHMGSVSAISILDLSRLNDPLKPELTFGSRAPGIGDPTYRYHQRISDAVKIRTQQMQRRAQLILSGYAKDISNGMKAQRRANQTASGVEQAIE